MQGPEHVLRIALAGRGALLEALRGLGGLERSDDVSGGQVTVLARQPLQRLILFLQLGQGELFGADLLSRLGLVRVTVGKELRPVRSPGLGEQPLEASGATRPTSDSLQRPGLALAPSVSSTARCTPSANTGTSGTAQMPWLSERAPTSRSSRQTATRYCEGSAGSFITSPSQRTRYSPSVTRQKLSRVTFISAARP